MAIFDPSDRELEKLRQTVAKSAKQVGNTVGLIPRPDSGPPSPAHHVALTPSGGIAPLRGVVPGRANCLIYQLTSTGLQNCGFLAVINNLFSIGISGFQFILVSQDKFGDWWVTGYYDSDLIDDTGTGTGTGGGDDGDITYTDIDITFINVNFVIDNSIVIFNYDTTIIFNNYEIIWGYPVYATLVTDICPDQYSAEARTTADVTINSTTRTDLTGATLTFTLARATKVVVHGIFDMDCNAAGTIGDTFIGVLDVNGSGVAGDAVMRIIHANQRLTVSQSWIVSLAIGTHTLKLQGARFAGTGACIFQDIHTKIVIHAETGLRVEKAIFALPTGTTYQDPTCAYDQNTCCDGSGPGSEPDDTAPVDTPCCAIDISRNLIGIIEDKTGFAEVLPDQITLTYGLNGSPGWLWADDDLCGGADLSIVCNGTAPTSLNLYSGAGIIGPLGQAPDTEADSPICDPLRLVYTVSGTYGCGVGSYKLTVIG